MMRIMYAYGQNRAADQEMVIGNIMRQVLEAFSTFEYKKGIEAVSTDEKIQAKMFASNYPLKNCGTNCKQFLNLTFHTIRLVKHIMHKWG